MAGISATQLPDAKGRRKSKIRRDVDPSLKLELPNPLSTEARNIITDKTNRLIVKQRELDKEFLRVSNERSQEYHQLLRRQRLLQKRKRRHIRKRSGKLTRRERYHRLDPRPERASDCSLIRKLLRRLKRHLGSDFQCGILPGKHEVEMSSEDKKNVHGKGTNRRNRVKHAARDVIANDFSTDSSSVGDKSASKKRKKKDEKANNGDGTSKKKHKLDLPDEQTSISIPTKATEVSDKAAQDNDS
ncbi:hypothetical protein F5B20DRAFT_374205 [Whalleya microplaca]|nr:hypothetical protein F5B20DRAFT_374205 [Whalleya microplaca]